MLITGESGTGKEVVARAIHEASRRASTRLVTVNCASVAESLLESELFGHVKGAFTGADRNKVGLLELGHRGTVFLDEIGEMSLRMQALLLRFLENGEIQPVGSFLPHQKIDVRVIAATNRSLLKGVQEGWFREDLYYRLNVVHLKLSPLRNRREDVMTLAEHFVGLFTQQQQVPPPRIPDAVIRRFVEYEWPGNVRELRNVIERLVVRRSGQTVTFEDLPEGVAQATPAAELPDAPPALRPHMAADQLFERMVTTGESFWSAVYPAFISRDLTRDVLRALVIRGLRQTRGNYRIMIPLFNMKDTDYRRFLAFLRKYDLHQPFHAFRTPHSTATADSSHPAKPARPRGPGMDSERRMA